MELVHLIGYAGSVVIAISLSMKNIIKLRWINLFGASTFATYGFLVGAYPVLALNSLITIIDIYHLIRIYTNKDQFSLVPVLSSSHEYLKKFLVFYKDDIVKYFPDFNFDDLEGKEFYFILRNLVPAGLFVIKRLDKNEAEIVLDYAVPAYRDLSNGKFVYDAENTFLKEKGIKQLRTYSNIKAHRKYLEKVGYKLSEPGSDLFIKSVD
ncbi:MAG: hypothetical protein K8F36_04245 [Melioribacteraceae bacterium]|nr:hypothetical protein [Melioribacteraceae bacterium]